MQRKHNKTGDSNMKEVVNSEIRNVEIGGVEEIGTFSVDNSAKMFKILISQLYSRKAEAVIRELCANAYDSHTRAGCADRPFELSIPDSLQTEFRIRDYGVSLTHERIMEFYTKIGASDKNATNTETGRFGLGSKIPFAVTDSFTITARLNGEKRIYNAFINSDNIPQIALFSRKPSKEETGLEITFSVDGETYKEFQSSMPRCMLGFDVLPITNVTLPVLNKVASGDGWYIHMPDSNEHTPTDYNHKYVHYNYPTRMHLRQGSVIYPVDFSVITNYLTKIPKASKTPKQNEPSLLELTNMMHGTNIIIDMPIGSVDMTPSRESLSYDDQTTSNIVNRLTHIFDDITREMREKVKSASSYFEAKKILMDFIKVTGWFRKSAAYIKWRNKSLIADTVITKSDIAKLTARFNVRISAIKRTVHFDGQETYDFGNIGPYDNSFFSPDKNTLIFHSEKKLSSREFTARTHEYWKRKDDSNLGTEDEKSKILKERIKLYISNSIVSITGATLDSQLMKRLSVMLRRYPFDLENQMVNLDDYSDVNLELYKRLPSLRQWNFSASQFLPIKGGNAEILPEDQILFVNTKAGVIYGTYGNVSFEFSSRNFTDMLQMAINSGIFRTKDMQNIKIIAIPKSQKLFASHLPENFNSFFDFFINLMQKKIDEKKDDAFNIDQLTNYLNAQKNKGLVTANSYQSITRFMNALPMELISDRDSPFREAYFHIALIKDIQDQNYICLVDFLHLKGLISKSAIKINRTTKEMDLMIKAVENLKNIYPILNREMVENHRYYGRSDAQVKADKTVIIDYINMVDEKMARQRAYES